MEQKSTLYIYRMRKKSIKEERYENNRESDIWFRAKTNCLDLCDKKRGESNDCKICGEEKEDLTHFLLNCKKLNHVRVCSIILQKPHNRDITETIGDFFFNNEDIDKKKSLLYQMWLTRINIIKNSS